MLAMAAAALRLPSRFVLQQLLQHLEERLELRSSLPDFKGQINNCLWDRRWGSDGKKGLLKNGKLVTSWLAKSGSSEMAKVHVGCRRSRAIR